MASSPFPLRFRQERIRALVREVAAREGISQNELLEQAAEHEVIARGALLADDLAASLEALRAMTSSARADVLQRTIADFADGEAMVDPLRARRISPPGEVRVPAAAIGAIDAFRRRV